VTEEELIQWAQGVAEKYEGKISRILGVPAADVVFQVEDLLGPVGQEYAATTSGTTITLRMGWFLDHPGDEGGIVHELVHAFQQVPEGAAGKKRIEAMADYVRLKLGLTYEGWTPSPGALRLEALGPDRVRRISQRLSSTDTGTAGTAGDAASNEGVPDDEFAIDWQAIFGETDEEKKQRTRNAAASFQNYVLGLGVGLTPNLQQLIQEAAKGNYNLDRFVNYLYQTPEFQNAFPGIFDEDGSLKMSTDQYLSNVQQYQSIAVQAGLNLGSKRLAWLFQNDVSPSEYAVKAPAVARMRRDPQLYAAFGRELVQGGLAKRGEVSKGELLKFAAGLGNSAWYDLWQDTVTRNAAVDAGIAIRRSARAAEAGGYATIGQGLLERISGKGLTEDQMAAGMQEVAQNLLEVLPLSKIQGYGLSKNQLATGTFGGPHQAAIRQRMEHILRTEEAFSAPRATAPEPNTGGGFGPSTSRPQA